MLGAISGYYGGIIDQVIMRLVDLLFAFPFLVLAIAVVSIVGPSLINMMIVLGAVSWITYARLVRGLVLSLREEEFVIAARALGASDREIIIRHILPNTLGIVVVQATFGVAAAIISHIRIEFFGNGRTTPHCGMGCDAEYR